MRTAAAQILTDKDRPLGHALRNRYQIFAYDGKETTTFPVEYNVPQGPIFEPHGFAAYTEDLADVLRLHGVHWHQYADDTQPYDSCRPTATDVDTRGCPAVLVLGASTPTKQRPSGSALGTNL
jgi:hypothetical protein